jgi:hypothetical protein
VKVAKSEPQPSYNHGFKYRQNQRNRLVFTKIEVTGIVTIHKIQNLIILEKLETKKIER